MIELDDLIGKPFASEPELSYGPHSYSCYGLVWEIYRRMGIDIPKTNISVTACCNASNKEILSHAQKYWNQLKEPRVPCAVLIKSTNQDYANHIGVLVEKNKIVHITINRNVVVDNLSLWKHKIIGYYEYVGNCRNN